jgi:hypothetical protein
MNFIDELIKSSLEYYDSYQPKIVDIINKTEYIKIKDNKNITDQIIFFDKNKKKIFESSFEFLSIFIPHSNIWKWAWSLPTAKKKNNFISRKLLDYAFNLDSDKDYLLRSTLINSKIKIINNLQLDIYVSLSAKLSKNPFILKIFIAPPSEDDYDEEEKFYPFRQINEDIDNNKYICYYLFILDFL